MSHADSCNEFISAFSRGLLCLHPTDTLVGLTAKDYRTLADFKQRKPQVSFVHLAADFASASRFWQPLPAGWSQRLRTLWPAALTVVWKAAHPSGREDNTIAMRVPDLPHAHAWFNNCLRTLQLIPSTSVNRHRQTPLTYAAAVALLQGDARVHVPKPLLTYSTPTNSLPSTVIRLHDDGRWTLLRSGAFPPASLPN